MRNIRFGSRRISVFIAVFMVLALVSVTHAITIIVDGDRESAWDGEGGQIPGSILDPNEPSINDNVDIQEFQWTNDLTNFYFLIDVWAAAPLMPALAPVNICFDTDNNVATDIPASNTIYRDRCSYGTGVSGMDTIVEAYRLPSGVLVVDVWDATVDPMVFIGSGTLGYNPAATNPVIEISVDVSLLGYSPGNCPSTIPIVIYYDGGDTNPDDNSPDNGSTSISCGSPTAVSLGNFTAVSNTVNNLPQAMGVVVLLLLALLSLGFVIVRRQSAQV